MKHYKKRTIALLLAFIIMSIVAFGQTVQKYDRVLDCKIYKSYYSYSIKAPSFVIYKLWHGGGNSSRAGLNFTGSYPHFDYVGSGYDKGHLANAEDFAYSYEAERRTFNYVNAIPQNPTLNRGPWKSLETRVRNLSQTDSLLIICGGADWNGLIPTKCFKIVYSLTTHKMLFAVIFNNDNSRICQPLSLQFTRQFTYQIVSRLYKQKGIQVQFYDLPKKKKTRKPKTLFELLE